MTNNQSDNSDEAMWDMDELLDDAEEEVDETSADTSSSSSNAEDPDDVPTWDMDELLDESESGEEQPTTDEQSVDTAQLQELQAERAPGSSYWFSRNGLIYVCSGLFVLVSVLYVAGPFEENASTNVQTQKSIRALTEADLQPWLKDMNRVASALSERPRSIQSSTLSGFSSEMQQRSELKRIVSNAIDGDQFVSFRTTTRDIGSALRLLSANTEFNGGDKPIHQNIQLVKQRKEDIVDAWNNVKAQQDTSSSRTAGSSSTSTSDSTPTQPSELEQPR